MARRIALICSLLMATAATGAIGASATGEPAASTAAASAVQVVTIDMTPLCKPSIFCYKPASVTVKRGGKVVWLNATAAPHTVTGVSGGPASGALLPGQPYTFTFKNSGSFTYYCLIHGFAVMHGTVRVI